MCVTRVIFVSAAVARYKTVVVDESLYCTIRPKKKNWKVEVKQVAVRKYLLHVWFKDHVNLEMVGYDDQALHLQKSRNIKKCELKVLAQLWTRKNVWGYFMGSQFSHYL